MLPLSKNHASEIAKRSADNSRKYGKRYLLPMGDAIPMQLIIVPRLSKTNNYWLNNLRNDLKSGGEIRNFIEKYGENKNSKLYQALADTIMRANWQELKEERKMCEALRELFADDLRESREEGIMEGRNVGKREGKLEGKREGEA